MSNKSKAHLSRLSGLGTKGFYARYKLDELSLLELTLEALA